MGDAEIRFIGEGELIDLLSMERAVDALEDLFREGLPDLPPRQHLDTGRGDLLLMPAFDERAVGTKLVTVAPGNPTRGLPLINGVYVLFDGESLRPAALFDAAPLTGMRTAAVSAVATRHLANPEARHLVVFGSGVQARWHIHAMRAVRPIEKVTIVARSRERAVAVAEEFEDVVAVRLGDPSAAADADIVCCCTTSDSPVFDGARLPSGAHVNAVGSYKPTARELDDAVMERAHVVAELLESVLSEAGDLVIPVRRGVVSPDDVVGLTDVVRGAAPRRRGDVTVFKSVGHAAEDLAVAVAAMEQQGQR